MKHTTALIYAIAIIIAAYLLGSSYVNRKKPEGTISVKGLGEVNFTSDLIVWSGSFSRQSFDIQEAYSQLERDRKKILNYFVKKGISKDEIIFSSITPQKLFKDTYNENGKYVGQQFDGYELTQSVKITSKKVNLVESVSREVSELINYGVNFYSDDPQYYYTKLATLKLDLIKKATENARKRAEQIAENSGATLGGLISAKMGVFQIVGQYSNEDYSWGGTFNTSSKNKTASITVSLVYNVK
jgi:hypothetical protein